MDNYLHKKFAGAIKRKRGQDEKSDDEDVVSIIEETLNNQPVRKRQRQGQLFRPWLDKEDKSQDDETPPSPGANGTPFNTYHANMVRDHSSSRQRNPQEEKRRDHNTLASLKYCLSKEQQMLHLEKQYADYRRQHEVNIEQQVRLNLYYVRFLQHALAQSHPIDSADLKRMPQQLSQQNPSLQNL